MAEELRTDPRVAEETAGRQSPPSGAQGIGDRK
jgi:hypothetical protein